MSVGSRGCALSASSSADFVRVLAAWHTTDTAALPPTGGTGSFRDAGLKMVVRPAGWCVIAVAAVVAAAGQATADCITNCYDPDEACPACYKD